MKLINTPALPMRYHGLILHTDCQLTGPLFAAAKSRNEVATHATVMIMQIANPRFTVMYLGARLAISFPAG